MFNTDEICRVYNVNAETSAIDDVINIVEKLALRFKFNPRMNAGRIKSPVNSEGSMPKQYDENTRIQRMPKSVCLKLNFAVKKAADIFKNKIAGIVFSQKSKKPQNRSMG